MERKVPDFESVRVGDEIPPLSKGPIERIQLVKYAGASGDFNPIHVDETFARAAGQPGVFAHGMLSMAFVGQLLTDWVDGRRIEKLGVRFVAITWPGDVITCKGKVTKKYEEGGKKLVELEVSAENQKGQATVKGTAVVNLAAGS